MGTGALDFGNNLVSVLMPSTTWGLWGRGRGCEGGSKGFTNTVLRGDEFFQMLLHQCVTSR